MENFKAYLIEQERSEATVEKYLRDVRKFVLWLDNRELNKSEVLAFKRELEQEYKITSANSILSAVNTYLSFLGRGDCRVKAFKSQKETFCSEEKELTKEEYERLLSASNFNLTLGHCKVEETDSEVDES